MMVASNDGGLVKAVAAFLTVVVPVPVAVAGRLVKAVAVLVIPVVVLVVAVFVTPVFAAAATLAGTVPERDTVVALGFWTLRAVLPAVVLAAEGFLGLTAEPDFAAVRVFGALI